MAPELGPLTAPGEAIYPPAIELHGTHTSLVPLGLNHLESLFEEICGPENAHLWTYLPWNLPSTLHDLKELISSWSVSTNLVYYAVLSGPASETSSKALGVISYLNIVPVNRSIEIGGINFGPRLKRTRVATEAFYLLMKHAFDLGYLRLEWKANHHNKPSLAAAERLGFVFEGVFRKHMIVKGRRRDTAWFSITDEEWPVIAKGLETWLHQDNFDEEGKQRRNLRQCRDAVGTL
ncbi:GNAT family acetyltransferase [Paramyrothecium foliicola]|nr:GNAT family acetyltransferase [Paramyrothecium foliicola]